MKIKKLSEAITPTAPKILLYGGSGSGKTTQIATLPGRVLILSAEAGLMSLAPVVGDGRFDVVEVETMAEVRDAYLHLRKGGHGYDWVVLDSLSEIAEVMLGALKRSVPDPRQAYGEIIDKMTALCREFRGLPAVGVVLISKEERQKDEVSGGYVVGPWMPGQKLGPALPYLFDAVLRTVATASKDAAGRSVTTYAIQTQGDGRTVAKVRGYGIDAIEPADLGALAAKMAAAGVFRSQEEEQAQAEAAELDELAALDG